MSVDLTVLESLLGHVFQNRQLLTQALTHKSRAAEDATGGVADNESLEFLGDAVLGLVVAHALHERYPLFNEGQKSKIKAQVVSTPSLARHAEQLHLGEHLLLGRGEEKTGGRFKQALLADIARVAHIAISYAIVVVASWHIGLGLKHHVFERNGFLRRMLPFCKP